MTATIRRRAPEVALQLQRPDAGHILVSKCHALHRNRLTVGFDYQHFGGESWNKVVAIDEAKPGQQIGDHIPGVDKQMDEFAGYVDFRQDINSWLSLDAGVRIDHHSHVGTEWIPQGGLAFHLPRQAELKAMVSKGFRNPTIREMYMFLHRTPI